MVVRQPESGAGPPVDGGRDVEGADLHAHFAPSLLFAAAKLYYEGNATQAEVAVALQTSRATVSRLLAAARQQGIVRIEVIPPDQRDVGALAAKVAAATGLQKVYLTANSPTHGAGRPHEDASGGALAPAVGQALSAVGLTAGDVLLVSSGRTIYEVARFELPKFPGVVVAPTVGGTDQPEAWYQTNEITRRVAERIGGRPTYLFAPALPGANLFDTLLADPMIKRILHLWKQARCVLTGVGAPPLLRSQAPQFVDVTSLDLMEAVGDVCSRFFDRAGQPVAFPGSERLIAVELETLKQTPIVIAVANGLDKVSPIIVGARAGFFTQLVTDTRTAEEILART